MAEKYIHIDRNSTIKILSDLEYLVTSLDYIGSMETSESNRAEIIARFVIEASLVQRLASVRKLISVAVDRDVAPEEKEKLDLELERVERWTP